MQQHFFFLQNNLITNRPDFLKQQVWRLLALAKCTQAAFFHCILIGHKMKHMDPKHKETMMNSVQSIVKTPKDNCNYEYLILTFFLLLLTNICSHM